MLSASFYLLGEDPSTARVIDIPDRTDHEGLQHLIASHFAVAHPKGIAFNNQDSVLESVQDVLAQEEAVSITIDGRAVRPVPGPQGLPYVGNYFEIFPDHVGNHQRLYQQYGPLFKTVNMGCTSYHTNDATLSAIVFAESDFFSKNIIEGHPMRPLKNPDAGIFVSDTNTEAWRMSHKFISPALGPKAVRHYAPIMQKVVEDSFPVFDELADRDEAWNAWPYMLKMSSSIIGKLVLGMDFKHFEAVDTPMHEVPRLIAHLLELNKKISTKGDWYNKLPFGDPARLRASKKRLDQLFEEAIEAASKGVEDLELQEAALKAENIVDYLQRATDNKGNKMPRDRLVDPLIVTIAAGFTTTTTILAWLIYGLVEYPGMQDRLMQELIDFGFTEDTVCTVDLINKMPFLDAYVKETLRRHSPSFQPARTSKVDCILPGAYKLPKDSVVISETWHVHNNPKAWDNPTRFDPDRWLGDQTNIPKGAFIPFATGQRMCIGNSYVLQAVKIFIPKLVYRYEFLQASEEAVEYEPYFQLIRPTNLYVRAEKRVKWPPKAEA
ncbi:cytochrome P450 [Lipomyces chichibuensis]|uniref:cytochrome P450 n=1 Tax=Lipomyces chichibuensis TaxID=1546026 RepID=UPI003343AD39